MNNKFLPAFRKKLDKTFLMVRQVSIRTFTEFQNDHCAARAGSLSYSTLMAVVPLSAFVVALLTAFGSFGGLIVELQRFLVDILLPTRQDFFSDLIDQFINNSQALGTVGFFLFAVTSINLIDNITMNINIIWGVRRNGNLIGRFTTYMSSLLFGTLLIAASFASRGILTSILPPELSTLWSLVVIFVPTFFMYICIFLLIAVVPGVKVDLKYAALSALGGVIFFELAKKAFVEGSSFMLRASVMYGSLALIPIFLFWLNIIWVIILASAELTYCLQFRAKPWSVHTFHDQTPAQRFSLGLQIFIMVASAFRKGEKPPGKKLISDKFGISLDDVSTFTALFVDCDLLRTVGKDEWALVPARPLESITFRDILGCLAGKTEDPPDTSDYFIKIWQGIQSKINSMDDVSLDDYLINEIVDEI
ncbi:MAG: YihY family inner membrane protein [Spirochaetales bacterium]|nr:YihY family inner membrane protein [Spirochaetales bacterium]